MAKNRMQHEKEDEGEKVMWVINPQRRCLTAARVYMRIIVSWYLRNSTAVLSLLAWRRLLATTPWLINLTHSSHAYKLEKVIIF